jgi:hypothetical protein
MIQHNKTHTRSHINQTNFFIWYIHTIPDFFLGLWPNQTFLNILGRFDQESVQLDRSFRIVHTKYQKHGSQVVVVSELHIKKGKCRFVYIRLERQLTAIDIDIERTTINYCRPTNSS